MAIHVNVQYNGGLLPGIILRPYATIIPSGNPIICHGEFLYLQSMLPRKRFDIFFPCLGDAQKFCRCVQIFIFNSVYDIVLLVYRM